MSLLIFILILVALIWVHELGHFIAAKLFGIRVSEFAIGFPPRLFKIRFGETLYSFGALLVGGFVNIFGENAQEGAGNPRSMASKPRPVQAAVIVAGVVMNLVFAWLALSAGYMAGMPASVGDASVGTVNNARPTVVGVLPESPAALAGVKAGDRVLLLQTATDVLDTRTLSTDKQAELVRQFIGAHAERNIILTVDRKGKEETLIAKGVDGLIEGRKAIGIHLDDVGVLQLPVHLAAVQGAVKTWEITVATAQGLSTFLFNVVRGAANWAGVAGPVGIATLGSMAVETGFSAVVFITAVISVNLALINLLPIPGLDGGRLLIISIESIIRRPVSPRVTVPLTLAGFALIIMLMVAVTYHDIAKLVG